ncbi:hypothetical protein GLOIN_2v1485334 [Rhizophagus clarus]|uniref:Uncharacterized protein n=1 Tax=Rhizophagus clarus TaxID=94130 RepID=A0A8H3QD18_9GLOM|nr:hypothetical protein GLOIN_2v1485334 [Rhizophagus clarus]
MSGENINTVSLEVWKGDGKKVENHENIIENFFKKSSKRGIPSLMLLMRPNQGNYKIRQQMGFADVRFTEKFNDHFNQFCEMHLQMLKKEHIPLLYNYAFHPRLVAFITNEIHIKFLKVPYNLDSAIFLLFLIFQISILILRVFANHFVGIGNKEGCTTLDFPAPLLKTVYLLMFHVMIEIVPHNQNDLKEFSLESYL